MEEWRFVKHRTAADGAVWRSADGRLYRRTGGASVLTEAQHQRELVKAGYPVPEVIEAGETDEGHYFFLERSAGAVSLHELALADSLRLGHVSDEVVAQAAGISTRLLEAQARKPLPGSARDCGWFSHAGFVDDVREENPDLDTAREVGPRQG